MNKKKKKILIWGGIGVATLVIVVMLIVVLVTSGDVLKDAKEEADIKETEEDILESAQEAYEANKKYTNACFAVPVKQSLKDKAINKADSFMNGDKNEQGIKDNKVNNLFVEHELIKKYRTDSEKLMKEKDQKGSYIKIV